MFGLSLIHAGFLAAGLAVGLPVLIHLLFRQKTRTVPIGSIKFLQQVVREHRRRRRVRQWILLSLRMLAVLLLALLFARPYWDESYRRGLETEIVLLVDRSASMAAKDSSGRTALDAARDAAAEQIKQLDDNIVVHVALCDAAGVKEIPLEELPTIESSPAGTDYGLAIGWANDVLAQSRRSTRKIVLLTDLQATGVPQVRPQELAAGIEFRVEDVGHALRKNLGILAVEPANTEIRADNKTLLRVTLRNQGALAEKAVAVKCTLAGPTGPMTANATIDVGGQGTATLELPLKIEQDGLYRGEVSIAGEDALAIDNRRYVAFEARHPERVLLVDGDQGRSIFASETYFLETALRLQTTEASGQLRSFEPERLVWDTGKGFPRLAGYRVIVLANVRRLTDDDAQRLQEFVSAGGSLLIAVGDQVSKQSLTPLSKSGLLPGEVAGLPVEGQFRVSEWDEKHDALACFADPQRGDMRRVEFHTLLPLTRLAPEARQLWKTGDHIAAAELAVGKGRVIYFGSTLDRDWTELPRTRMYVPLVRQLMAHLTNQLAERALVVNHLANKADDKLGIAEDRTPGSEGRYIVTNLDPRESALERVTVDQLYDSLGIDQDPDESAREAALAAIVPAGSLRPDEIWTTIVWLLLIVLAAETLLAGRVHA